MIKGSEETSDTVTEKYEKSHPGYVTVARFFSEIETAIDNLGGKITIYDDTKYLQLARKP
jgi:hypothetical protein